MTRRCPRRTPVTSPLPGVTLVELLVVIVLITVAAGLIIPRMGGSIAAHELREAAARFAQTARTAREFAVARQEVCAIEIDLDRGCYHLTMQSDKEGADSFEEIQMSWLKPACWPRSLRVRDYRRPDGTSATSGQASLRFFPDGTTSGASIALATERSEWKIVVHPHSGQVQHGNPQTAEFLPDQYDFGD